MGKSSTSSTEFTLLYFASAASFTGKESERFPAPTLLDDFFGKLEEAYPGIREKVIESCAVTINLEYVDLEDDLSKVTIKPGDEVALIPPVSSG